MEGGGEPGSREGGGRAVGCPAVPGGSALFGGPVPAWGVCASPGGCPFLGTCPSTGPAAPRLAPGAPLPVSARGGGPGCALDGISCKHVQL